ncbi:hypothetical protein M885DRAFT_311234 [Pelagophyceae sp. CCMP2097]|nr:hypothetical protein M885DRAFT_311234 [Pelagophyceae sp. CCMP2097]
MRAALLLLTPIAAAQLFFAEYGGEGNDAYFAISNSGAADAHLDGYGLEALFHRRTSVPPVRNAGVAEPPKRGARGAPATKVGAAVINCAAVRASRPRSRRAPSRPRCPRGAVGLCLWRRRRRRRRRRLRPLPSGRGAGGALELRRDAE